MSLKILIILLTYFSSYSYDRTLTRPIIGIISTPSDFHDLYHPTEFSYIKGTYAEFIEAGGGIPLAIPWDLDEAQLIKVLDSINGILFTGGDANLWEFDPASNGISLSNFTKRVSLIVNYVIDLNNRGVYFPMFGICQGHEVIALSLAGKADVIDNFVHTGQLDSVSITNEGQKSRMFRDLPEYLIQFLRDTKSMFYHHRYGLHPSLMTEDNSISNHFIVTAKGIDDNGKEFIAAMEAKDYPIYTVQYHPERILLEWKNKLHFNHPDESGQAVLEHTFFLISEAMKNQQKFDSEEIFQSLLINNHEYKYFNITWPRVHFYQRNNKIIYSSRYSSASEACDSAEYDCKHHDCSFMDIL